MRTDDTGLSEREREKKIKYYTTPRNNFKYSKITFDEYMNNIDDGYATTRSGIIPMVHYRGRNYWLLGSFHDYPGKLLMDFGGGTLINEKVAGKFEKNRQTPFGGAMLELQQESKGLLTLPVLKSLGSYKKEEIEVYVGKDYNSKTKVYFLIVFLPLEEVVGIPKKFSETPDADEAFGPMGFYEESEIINKKYLTTHVLTSFIDYTRRKVLQKR